MRLVTGFQLGPYELDALIGRGASGEVYRGRDTRVHRNVAVKVLSPGRRPTTEDFARFAREARTGALLNHPAIASVYDVGVHDDMPFVVSELLQGQTLRARLRDGALPQSLAIRFALQIADGLAAAHQIGVVHRDLRPENIFVTDAHRVTILDFGFAMCPDEALELLQHADSASTRPGTILGTIAYWSPEQVHAQSIDHRSDIFSLGVILHEMLSGTTPFRGESVVDTLNAILKDDPPALCSEEVEGSVALDGVIRQCLEKAPEARLQSARELVFHLESIRTAGRPHGMAAGECCAGRDHARVAGVDRSPAARFTGATGT